MAFSPMKVGIRLGDALVAEPSPKVDRQLAGGQAKCCAEAAAMAATDPIQGRKRKRPGPASSMPMPRAPPTYTSSQAMGPEWGSLKLRAMLNTCGPALRSDARVFPSV